MIKIIRGNIFECDAEVLVNPVNTDGIMGKGLAYQFKARYPKNFKNYYEKCINGEFSIKSKLIFTEEKNKIIVNFPTKKNWREDSKIQYIRDGLEKLKELMIENNFKSIALPPLGTGNGNLDWKIVKIEIVKFAKELSKNGCIVYIFEPKVPEEQLENSHLYISILLEKINNNQEMKKKISIINLQRIAYIFEFFSGKELYKFDETGSNPYSEIFDKNYYELKEYSRKINFNLGAVNRDLKLKYNSLHFEKDESFIMKAVKFYSSISVHSNNNEETIEKKRELIILILGILKNRRNISSDDLYNEIFTRKGEGFFSIEEIHNVIKFLKIEGVIEIDIFDHIKIKNFRNTEI